VNGDAEDAGEDALEEVAVVLEAAGEEVPEEGDDVVVVALGVAGVDGRVVLVDEDHHPLAVVLGEQPREQPEGDHEVRARGPPLADGGEQRRVRGGELAFPEQVRVAVELLGEDVAHAGDAGLPGRWLDVLEAHEDDRIALEVRPGAPGRGHREAGEQRAPVVGALLQEALEHREVERLAEAAGPGQEQDLAAVVEHRVDQRGLVDVVVAALPQVAEVGDADGEAEGRGAHRHQAGSGARRRAPSPRKMARGALRRKGDGQARPRGFTPLRAPSPPASPPDRRAA
jgi:hypothetical protein